MIRRNNKEKEQRKKIKFISQNIEQKVVMENLKLEICHLTKKISRERENRSNRRKRNYKIGERGKVVKVKRYESSN